MGDRLSTMGGRQREAVSMIFATAAPRSSLVEQVHHAHINHRHAVAKIDYFAELCPNLAEIIYNGEEPFYSSEEAATTRHKIGGPGVARWQILLDPCGADCSEELDLDFWDVYPRGRYHDEITRAQCEPWLPREGSSDSLRQAHAY